MDAVLHDRITVAGRRAFGEKSALGAGWNNDCVFDDLRLHQAENFGAKILTSIRPAQTTARNVAAAKMHAFDLGGIDENLEFRFG